MENVFNFTDENGNLLSLEDVQEQVKAIYSEIEESMKEPYQEICGNSAILDYLNPESHFDVQKIFENYAFLDRSLYLTGEIKAEHGLSFVDSIRFWNHIDYVDKIPPEDRTPIKIYIDTEGGDLNATLSIVAAIKLSKTPVWTIVTGVAESGGFFVTISGDKRIGYPHSSYMFHEGSCINGGDAHKYMQYTDFYRRKLEELKQLVIEKTNIDQEKYEQHKKDDWWMTDNDALYFGVIDDIATEII